MYLHLVFLFSVRFAMGKYYDFSKKKNNNSHENIRRGILFRNGDNVLIKPISGWILIECDE